MPARGGHVNNDLRGNRYVLYLRLLYLRLGLARCGCGLDGHKTLLNGYGAVRIVRGEAPFAECLRPYRVRTLLRGAVQAKVAAVLMSRPAANHRPGEHR